MTDAPEGAPPPAGNAKTHSTPSHDDGGRREQEASVAAAAAAAAASLGSSRRPSAPHSAPVASRGAMRRRHCRRTCRARVHSAPSIRLLHARAREASVPGALLCVHGRARHGVRAHLLRSASASRREAKEARRSMANGENVGTDLSPARAACVGGSLRGHELARLGSQSASPPWRARFKARGERGAQIDGKWRD